MRTMFADVADLVYEVELAVSSTTVTVSAGGTTTANIASSLEVRTALEGFFPR
jgi:hypothetical protein